MPQSLAYHIPMLDVGVERVPDSGYGPSACDKAIELAAALGGT